MPDSNAKKVAECIEIIGEGLFNAQNIQFLRDMERKLKDSTFRLTLPQQKYIDGLYEKACKSPY